MKKFKDCQPVEKAKKVLRSAGLPQMLLLRIFTAFFAFSAAMLFLMRRKGISPFESAKEYIANIDFPVVIICCLVLIGVLTVLHMVLPKKLRVFDPGCTIASVLLFDWVLLYRQADVYVTIATALVSLVVIGYALGKFGLHNFFDKGNWRIYGGLVLVAAVGMAVYISVCTICRYYTFGAGAVDFGLFVQSFHSLAENLTAVNSCERDVLMSHFNIHSSYIFYLFVPIFKIFPYAETLLILQAVFAMGGIVPLMLILKERKFKGLSMLCVGLAYTFSISLIYPCFYDFHENAFLPTLLMWTLWAIDTKRYIPFYVFSVLVCLVKEDAPLFIICIGLYAFFEQKGSVERLHGLIMAVLSGAYMLFITNWLVINGDGVSMTSKRFGHLMIEGDSGVVDVLVNALRNPGYLFSTLVTEATLPFLVQVMMPLLFLPFFTKKIHRFLLMLPFVITNLVVGFYYRYAGEIGYQYIFGPATLLIFMMVINVDDMSDGVRKNIPILVFASSFVFFSGVVYSNTQMYYNIYARNKASYTLYEKTLQSIPQDSVIGGESTLVSHLCDRKEIYIFDKKDMNDEMTAMLEPDRYDYIVLGIGSEVYTKAVPILEENGYTLWDSAGDFLAIYKHPDR